MADEQPTKEELQAEFNRRRRQSNEDQDISQIKSPSTGRPTDEKGVPITYDAMKSLWLQRQGKNGDWSVPDNSEHSIEDMPKPSEGRLQDQKGSYITYEQARERFFELQGRKDPFLAKKMHNDKTRERNERYE